MAWVEHSIGRARDWRSRTRPGPFGDFVRAGGNELLVADLAVSAADLVIDVGAYHGQWADEIMCRYGARVTMIEPVPAFADRLMARYKSNERVTLIRAALSNRIGRASLAVAGEGSSLFRDGAATIEADLIDAADLLERAPDGCALLKLNIEGAEYDVLDRLIESGQLGRIKSLLVQFHDHVPDCAKRRDRIRAALQATHRCRFDYPFVWECWQRR